MRFSLRLLRGRVPFYVDCPNYEAAVRPLREETIVEVTEDDVEAWVVDPAPSAQVTLVLTEAAVARLRDVNRQVHEVPVRVSLDGSVLYVAKEYSVHGAAAIVFPVVHRDRLAGHRELVVREGLLGGYPARLRLRGSGLIDRPELRAFFLERGALREV